MGQMRWPQGRCPFRPFLGFPLPPGFSWLFASGEFSRHSAARPGPNRARRTWSALSHFFQALLSKRRLARLGACLTLVAAENGATRVLPPPYLPLLAMLRPTKLQ